ncbi:MAG: hypothetical protein ACUVQV_07105 [Dissulfurimicrobium sp.]|uniref:hypothetical protein n=1 Tax=Dissulfurimicrobium sp. TaxID=2022436 RepID=UPI00404AB1E6
MGTAVTGGMLSATFIDLLFIPFFFVLISRLFGRRGSNPSSRNPLLFRHEGDELT